MKGVESMSLSYGEIREWQRATQGTGDVAFSSGGVNIADGPAGAILMTEVEASQNLFPLLGAKPVLGRGFLPEEEENGRTGVVVLSFALWQQTFGGDRDVLGKTLHIGGKLRTVVGVMPRQFLYPIWENRPQAWVSVERGKFTAADVDLVGGGDGDLRWLSDGKRTATAGVSVWGSCDGPVGDVTGSSATCRVWGAGGDGACEESVCGRPCGGVAGGVRLSDGGVPHWRDPTFQFGRFAHLTLFISTSSFSWATILFAFRRGILIPTNWHRMAA